LTAQVYEGMLLLDSNRYARDPSGVSGRIGKLIEQAGGEMIVSRLWSEQRLAYPIKGQRKGTYWLTYFRLEGPSLDGLKRQCAIDDAILRNLILAVDPRMVDVLIQHASGEEKAETPAKTEEKGPPAETAAAAEGDAEPSIEATAEPEPQQVEATE